MVTQPTEIQSHGDVTDPVTGPVVISQDHSPVHDTIHPGSLTPVTQGKQLLGPLR